MTTATLPRLRAPILGAFLLSALGAGSLVILLASMGRPAAAPTWSAAIGVFAALIAAGTVAGGMHAATRRLRSRNGAGAALGWCTIAWSALATLLAIGRLALPSLHLVGVDAESAELVVGWRGAAVLAAAATVFALMMADAEHDEDASATSGWLGDVGLRGTVLGWAGAVLIAWTSYSVLWRDTRLPIPDTPEQARRILVSARHEAEMRPRDARTQLAYGASLVRFQRHREALPILERAARLDTANAYGRVLLAWSLTQLDRIADAVPHLEAATRLAPEYAIAQRGLAWNLARLGRWTDAETAYRRAMRLSPGDASIASEYSMVLLQQSKRKAALAQALRAERLDPQSVGPHMLAGYLLRTEARFDESRSRFREAVRLNPKLAEGWAELGVTEYLRHDAAAAVAAFSEAARLDSSYFEHRASVSAMWRAARAGRTDDLSMGFAVGPVYRISR